MGWHQPGDPATCAHPPFPQVFEPLSAFDSGEYHCEATNNVGPPQKSSAVRMEASKGRGGQRVTRVSPLCGAALGSARLGRVTFR